MDPTDVVAETAHLPRHVAIIMDGNGRWAKDRGLPRHAGHKAGVESVRSTVEQCVKYRIEVLTLFAFSSENWQRPAQEVGLLMELFLNALQREAKRLNKNNVRLRVIGERGAFPAKLQASIGDAETLTDGNDGLLLQIAANYGGRWEITEAARDLASRVAAGEILAQDIDESALSGALALAGVPDPDLYIRTGGEQRLSNFLLWQAAYSELYFTETLWPDFSADAFDRALAAFAKRHRRFGKTGDQLSDSAQGS
jgi:undecaprenyl diphosphate synthase